MPQAQTVNCVDLNLSDQSSPNSEEQSYLLGYEGCEVTKLSTVCTVIWIWGAMVDFVPCRISLWPPLSRWDNHPQLDIAYP